MGKKLKKIKNNRLSRQIVRQFQERVNNESTSADTNRPTKWKKTDGGTKTYAYSPVKIAYRILLILEDEEVPIGEVDNIFKALQDILRFQKIAHSADDEDNPNWPR